MSVQPLLSLPGWVPVLDGHHAGVRLYEGHYSAEKSLALRRLRGTRQFGGMGERMVLLLADETALFVWRRQQRRMDVQTGVECSVFRNDGRGPGRRLSSELIGEAECHAWGRWPGQRLFTFVDAARTSRCRSAKSLPGACFRHAGWTEWGFSAGGLMILERLP